MVSEPMLMLPPGTLRSLGCLARLQTLRMRGCATQKALPRAMACSQRTLDMCMCSRLVPLPESLSCCAALHMFTSASELARQRSHSTPGRPQRRKRSNMGAAPP